jgi:hypothetical protein
MLHFVLLPVVLACVVNIAQAQSTVLLSFNPDIQTVYECACKFSTFQRKGGKDVRSEIDLKFDLDFVGGSDSLVTMKAIFRQMKLDLVAPDITLHTNSDDPMPTQKQLSEDGKATMLKAVKTLMGHAYIITVKRTGEVTTVRCFDEMLDIALDSIAFNPVQRPYIRKSLEAQFGNSAMKNTFNQMFHLMPAHGVKANDRWIINTSHRVLTLKSHDKKTVLLDSQSDNTSSPDVETGTVTLDIKTGLPLNIDLKQSVGEEAGKNFFRGSTIVQCKPLGKP